MTKTTSLPEPRSPRWMRSVDDRGLLTAPRPTVDREKLQHHLREVARLLHVDMENENVARHAAALGGLAGHDDQRLRLHRRQETDDALPQGLHRRRRELPEPGRHRRNVQDALRASHPAVLRTLHRRLHPGEDDHRRVEDSRASWRCTCAGCSRRSIWRTTWPTRSKRSSSRAASPSGWAASHMCMVMRGVEQESSFMETNVLRGEFLPTNETRQEFMSIVNRRGQHG